MTHLETRLRDTLTRVADATPIPSMPHLGQPDVSPRDIARPLALVRPLPDVHDSSNRRRPRTIRQRIAVAAAASAVTLVTGVSLAAAGVPVLPASVRHAFVCCSFPNGVHGISLTERLILRTTGPDGRAMTLSRADASDGGYCILFSTGNNGFGVSSLYTCVPQHSPFGAEAQISDNETQTARGYRQLITAFAVNVPGAATVRVVFGDGTRTTPLPIALGWTEGWLTATQTRHAPVLVGYDEAGKVIGRRSLEIH